MYYLYVQKVKQLLSANAVLNLSVPKWVKSIPASCSSIFTYVACKLSSSKMWRWSPEDKLIMPSPKNMVGWLRRREIWTFTRWNKQHWKLMKCHCDSAKSVNRYTWVTRVSAEMCQLQTCSNKRYTVKRKIGCRSSVVKMWRKKRRILLVFEMRT